MKEGAPIEESEFIKFLNEQLKDLDLALKVDNKEAAEKLCNQILAQDLDEKALQVIAKFVFERCANFLLPNIKVSSQYNDDYAMHFIPCIFVECARKGLSAAVSDFLDLSADFKLVPIICFLALEKTTGDLLNCEDPIMIDRLHAVINIILEKKSKVLDQKFYLRRNSYKSEDQGPKLKGRLLIEMAKKGKDEWLVALAEDASVRSIQVALCEAAAHGHYQAVKVLVEGILLKTQETDVEKILCDAFKFAEANAHESILTLLEYHYEKLTAPALKIVPEPKEEEEPVVEFTQEQRLEELVATLSLEDSENKAIIEAEQAIQYYQALRFPELAIAEEKIPTEQQKDPATSHRKDAFK